MWIPHTYKHKPKLHIIYVVGIEKWGIVLLWSHLNVVDLYGSEERPSVAIRIEHGGDISQMVSKWRAETHHRSLRVNESHKGPWLEQSPAYHQPVPIFGQHRRLNRCPNERLLCGLLLLVAVPNTIGVSSLPLKHTDSISLKAVANPRARRANSPSSGGEQLFLFLSVNDSQPWLHITITREH